jgi:hypothetical protein
LIDLSNTAAAEEAVASSWPKEIAETFNNLFGFNRKVGTSGWQDF